MSAQQPSVVARLRRHAARNAVSYVALFVALGGTASATVILSSNADVGPGVIAGSKAASGLTDNVIDSSLGTNDLADATISKTKLAPGSVDSPQIQDGHLLAQDLATSAVTNPKLADGAATGDKIGTDVLRKIDINLTAPDATNVDIGNMTLFAYCRPVGGTTQLLLQLNDQEATGTARVNARWTHTSAGAAVPELFEGASSLAVSATLFDVAGQQGQGELTWQNDAGIGSGVFHYNVDADSCDVRGALFEGVPGAA